MRTVIGGPRLQIRENTGGVLAQCLATVSSRPSFEAPWRIVGPHTRRAFTSRQVYSKSSGKPTVPATSKAVRLNTAFFKRPVESQLLENALLSTPTEILLLLGPRGSGKTALLRQVVQNLRVASPSVHVSYVDGKKHDMTDPAAFAMELASGFFPPVTNGWRAAGAGTADLAEGPPGIQTHEGLTRGSRVSNLGELLESYERFMDDQTSSDSAQLVIVVDGCEVLRRWLPEHGPQAEALLSFAVRMSCQERRVRMVLATYDGTFVDWLGGKVGCGCFRTEQIPDLPEEEVPAFLRHLRPELSDADLTDGNVTRILQVCGGNPRTLVRLAAAFLGDLEAALHAVTKDVGTQVREALSSPPQEPPSWTREHYAAAVRALASGPGNNGNWPRRGVPLATLLQQLPGPSGRAALDAMVERRLLAVTPAFSDWVVGVPAEARRALLVGGGCLDDRLVAAASAVHLHKMRLLAGELEGGPRDSSGPSEAGLEVASYVPTASNVASPEGGPHGVVSFAASEGSDTTAPEPMFNEYDELLKEVYDDIWAVEIALQEVDHQMAALQLDQPEGWEWEVEAQAKAREQLREEKELLQGRASKLTERMSPS